MKTPRVICVSPGDTVALAPVYDVVTTTAYIRKDVPALSLAGAEKGKLHLYSSAPSRVDRCIGNTLEINIHSIWFHPDSQAGAWEPG